LQDLALQVVEDAQQKAGTRMDPALGGGTRLILALSHRISHDIDLFIRDPQWIGYLTPRLNDAFESTITGYEEGATHLKLRRPEGEIDFIVGMSLMGLPTQIHPESPFALEPVSEVLAKKLFYRGWALTARDLFDWRSIVTAQAMSEQEDGALGQLLSSRLDVLSASLEHLRATPAPRSAWASIESAIAMDMDESIEWAEGEIQRYAASNVASNEPAQHPSSST